MSGSLVFITGATGFIGVQTAASVLAAGHRVRISVRKPEQAQAVKKLFAQHGDKVETAVVPDITDSKSFAPVLKGVEYILHLASPLPGAVADLQTGYVQPAVEGTLAILESAKNAPTIKRVVITSSVVALVPPLAVDREGQRVEENANQSIEVDVFQKLAEDHSAEMIKYRISKILAHRATLDWVAKEKPAFDVATVHPVYVIGIDLWQTTPQPRAVNGLFYLSLSSEQPAMLPNIVDVRDVAEVHLRALTTAKLRPRGEVTEYIAAGPATSWGAITAFVKTKYPAFPVKLANPPSVVGLVSNTTRAERDLGIEWRTTEQSVGSFVEQQLSLQAEATQ